MGLCQLHNKFIVFLLGVAGLCCVAQHVNGAIPYQVLEQSCTKESLPGLSEHTSVSCNNNDLEQFVTELSICEVHSEKEVAVYVCIDSSWEISSGTEIHSRDKRFWGAFFAALIPFLGLIEVVFCTFKTGNKGCQSESAPVRELKPPKYASCRPSDLQTEYIAEKKQKEVTVQWTEPGASDEDGSIVSNEQTCCTYKRGEKFPGLPDAGLEHTITYTAKDNMGLTATCSFKFVVKYKTCEEPETPLNGRKLCPDGYIYGGNCAFECDAGYVLIGDASAMCLENRTWDRLPTCNKITCPAPFEIENGKVVCDSPLLAYQEDCVFECDDGFKQDGPRKMTCQADGMWSLNDTQVSCKDDSPPQINCKSPQVFYADRSKFETIVTWIEPNATDNIDQAPTIVKLSGPENGDQLTEGIHTVVYKSTDSAGNSFPALSECTINIEVKVIKCSSGPSDALDNSRFLMFNCSDTTFYNGVTCTLGCDLNLPLNGTDQISCERNGTSEKGVWSWGNGSQPVCHVVQCPTLDPPNHGAFTTNSVQARPLHVMLCQTGYDVPSVGASFVGSLTCQDNGEWFPLSVFPECIVPTFPWLNLPAELYYEGTCNDEETQNKIKEQILVYLQGIQADIDNSICRQNDTCKVENVVVVCGDSSGRKRRQEHHIGKRQSGYAIAYFDIKTIYNQGTKTTQEAYPVIKGLLTAIALKIQEDINNGDLDVDGFTLSHDAFNTATETFSCDPGYKRQKGSLVCKPCPPGTYLNSTTGNCEFCKKGEYMAEEGAVKCHLCSDGYSTMTTGAKSQNECLKLCRAGFFSATTMEPCSACPVSTYQSSRGQAKCISCEYGLTTSGTNSTSVHQCRTFDFVTGPTAQITKVGSYNASTFTILTISLWLKLHRPGNTGEFSLYISDTMNDILIFSVSDVISVRSGNSATFNSDQSFSAGKWSHIIGTLDIASRTIQVYMNGQLTVYSSNLPIDGSTTVSKGTVSMKSNVADAYFSRFVLYGRALSDSERLSLSQSCTVEHGDEMFSMVDILQSSSSGIAVVLPTTCDPIDECETGPCGHHRCINDVGRFQCVCHSGMTGERCEIPPDYCEDNDCDQGECVPGNGSYSCNCRNGYTGPICDIPPVDGIWSDWMEWTGCDKTCGGGTRNRTRSCDNPPKGYMGADCAGNEKEVETCNEGKCPECPHLRRQYGTTLSCTNNNANGLKECNMTCITGMSLPNGQTPFETYSCGETTNYTWVPIDKTPTCVDLSPPDIFGTQTTLTYTSIPDDDKTAVSTAIEEKFSDMDCVISGKCSLSSTVSDSSANRKRRSTASTMTVQFTIQVTENGDLAIADYIANGTETAAMTELLSTLNSISAFISFIQNSTKSIFDVTVNGVQYKLENTTPSFTLTVMCPTGYAGADRLCGKCAAGTKQVDTYCINCDVGTYQDLTGQTVCNPCPTGYTTSTYGAADISECNVATGSSSTERSRGDSSEKLTIILAVCMTAAAVIVVVGVVVFVWKKNIRKTFRKSGATGSFASLSMVRPNSGIVLESENAKEKFNFNVNTSHNGQDIVYERKHTTLSVTDSD